MISLATYYTFHRSFQQIFYPLTMVLVFSVLHFAHQTNAQPPSYGGWSSYGKVEPAWWNGWGGSEGWSPSWGPSWDWGWPGNNELPNYSVRQSKPKQAVFEAAEALLLGQKKNNQTIRGVVQIYQFMDEYIDFKGIICNLRPNSVHGLHVHKFGEIHPNCTSTLGHFNPYKQKHGPHKNERIEDRHLGDLGNIMANASGIATFRIKDYNLRIDDNRIFSILGRSLVLHAREDDLGNDKINAKGSEHNGNSGIPIACGVIGLAQSSNFNSKPLRC